MFIIPVKMKWMAIFYVVIVVYEMIQYVMAGAWYLVIPIVASLLNFIIFTLEQRISASITRRRSTEEMNSAEQWNPRDV